MVTIPALRAYPEREDRRADRLERLCLSAAGLVVAPMAGMRARRLRSMVARVAGHGTEVESLENAALRAAAREAAIALRRHGLKDAGVARAFALIREVAKRTVGISHFDVQIIGGFAMLKGMVAEMQTGEGKTLTATLPAATAALAGIPVHIVTVNDYLAGRDAASMRPIYEALGLTVGVVVHGMTPDERREAYRCDVTYCTNKELAFDYLRDQMLLCDNAGNLRLKFERVYGTAARVDRLVLRGLAFAIVDEADSVLIDEARTPLIISGEANAALDREKSEVAMALAARLEEGADYRVRRDERQVELTERGRALVRDHAADLGGEWSVTILREELVTQALAARLLFHRDEHYLIQDGKVQIIDEYTGRVMPDRFWGQGLHQLVEVKEGCAPSGRRVTLARITYQRFFRRYKRLAGMTGTAREVAGELWSVFGLRVATIPPNRPCRRSQGGDHVFAVGDEKWSAIVDRVAAMRGVGRPVLVGTRSLAASETISGLLTSAGLAHQVLNASQSADEAGIIARAGETGRITVATNMAGRGTDIKLSPEVAERGGLHVIISERHAAGRIDRQLAGRCARQGDLGSVEAFLSLEDVLLEVSRDTVMGHTLQHSARLLGAPCARLAFRHAQRRAERLHAKARRELLRHDEALGKTLAFSGGME